MLSVNLSRIHSMVKNAAETLRQLQADFEGTRLNYSFQILQSTSDGDLTAFREKINIKKQSMLALLQRMTHVLDYMEYLRSTLAEQNVKNGIEPKLLRETALRRKLAALQVAGEYIVRECGNQVDEEMPVDYYKAAFTESSRSYSLNLRMFNDADIEKIKQERASLETILREVGDEIAFLNQTTVVEIFSLEEFAAKNYGRSKQIGGYL